MLQNWLQNRLQNKKKTVHMVCKIPYIPVA